MLPRETCQTSGNGETAEGSEFWVLSFWNCESFARVTHHSLWPLAERS